MAVLQDYEYSLIIDSFDAKLEREDSRRLMAQSLRRSSRVEDIDFRRQPAECQAIMTLLLHMEHIGDSSSSYLELAVASRYVSS